MGSRFSKTSKCKVESDRRRHPVLSPGFHTHKHKCALISTNIHTSHTCACLYTRESELKETSKDRMTHEHTSSGIKRSRKKEREKTKEQDGAYRDKETEAERFVEMKKKHSFGAMFRE